MAMSTGLCTRCNRTHVFPVMETRIKFTYRIQFNSEEAANDMKKAIEKALSRPRRAAEPIFQPMPLMALSRQVIRQTMNNGRFYSEGAGKIMNQILFQTFNFFNSAIYKIFLK